MDHRTKCKMQNYKPLEDNTGETLDDLAFDNDFLDTIPEGSMKEGIDKLDFTET